MAARARRQPARTWLSVAAVTTTIGLPAGTHVFWHAQPGLQFCCFMQVVIADRKVARIRSLVAGPTIRLFFADAARAGSALVRASSMASLASSMASNTLATWVTRSRSIRVWPMCGRSIAGCARRSCGQYRAAGSARRPGSAR